MFKKKVPAFTMTEILIGLIVTSIIISIIFLLFQISGDRLVDVRVQNEETVDMNRFSYTINKSIFESKSMNIKNDKLSFSTYNNTDIIYHFQQDYVIRNEKKFSDTLFLKYKQIICDTIVSDINPISYQCLKCTFYTGGMTKCFSYYKKIYPADLLNQ
ncbi:hypothetical protein [Flavobacterium rhizosphaerae]|uniref:Prepilin-type N-terminal cleavage/methylation domain-containing protein n=1 Tax=Flavobacterium rhizosphaerae TaxID=3163298 RepID=A0ABW8YVL2_9FLAO